MASSPDPWGGSQTCDMSVSFSSSWMMVRFDRYCFTLRDIMDCVTKNTLNQISSLLRSRCLGSSHNASSPTVERSVGWRPNYSIILRHYQAEKTYENLSFRLGRMKVLVVPTSSYIFLGFWSRKDLRLHVVLPVTMPTTDDVTFGCPGPPWLLTSSSNMVSGSWGREFENKNNFKRLVSVRVNLYTKLYTLTYGMELNLEIWRISLAIRRSFSKFTC